MEERMRALLILGALLAMAVGARAQTPQQQAAQERSVEMQHCQYARDADLRAGVPGGKVAQMYQNCMNMAQQKYNQALAAIQFPHSPQTQGNGSSSSNPYPSQGGNGSSPSAATPGVPQTVPPNTHRPGCAPGTTPTADQAGCTPGHPRQ
jgi:hypothetical protein